MSDTLKPTKISREGVILIKSFEGFRPRAIQRADGRWTIGYGHTASAREGLTVSETDAELLLQYDLIPVAKAVDAVSAPLNQHQYDALASFAFSVGVDRFRTSDVLARLNAGAPAEAADALVAWTDDSAIAAPPRRRAAERALFVARPDAPVSLADLLAAPLPPPAATLIETTTSTAPNGEASAFDAIEVAPFPADAEVEPMTREAAVAALLGEDAAAFPSAPEGVEEIHADTESPDTEAKTDPVDDVVPAQDEAEPDEIPAEAPSPVAAPVATPRTTWPSPNPATFYSPYALRAVGPLQSFVAPRPTPVEETVGTEDVVEADTPETVETPTEAAPEIVPANDAVPTEEPGFSETAAAAEAAVEPEPAPELLADAEPKVEVEAAPELEPEPVAPVEIEPLQYQEAPVFVDLHDQPVQVPVFAPISPAPAAPTLVLTEAPGLQETAADHRLPWPETNGFAHLDQTPLFEPQDEAQQDAPLQLHQDAEPPRRLDWSETATFLIMGGIGLISFGAAMAAFRRAAESNGGDTALIGWVLAVIALACVSVSGYNLYQRWGRADRA